MSRLMLTLAAALVLSACQRAQEPAPAPETAEPAAAASQAAAPPPAPEVPVGQCGDQSAVEADARIANTPRWSTAAELDNFGFDVYRGEAEDGPFERLTAAPIPGAGTSDEPHSYSFRDDTIDPCKDYWYYVESISTNGNREKFTPTFRAPAKRRAAD
ncbi:MAG: hypothetical protein KF823_13235 [Xanthomonadales bacterium]|nr:hypothetical protein [Xanthomonadales bacterium]